MTDLKTLEKKVNALEDRLNRLECDREWMDQLYKKAKELVIKNNKAAPFFLQRKLLIDFERAKQLLDRLEKDGIIGPALVSGSRKILTK